MKSFEFAWQTQDGIDIHGRGWEPDFKPRAVVCLVHGLGEHAGRYEHVARVLTHNGYAMIGFDQRGHGRSGGARGHTPSYEALMQGIDSLLAQAQERYPGLPRFLYGHSMGGNEVINYVIRRKPTLAGVIATGPFLRQAIPQPAAQVAMARLLYRVFPAFTQRNGLDTSALARDPKVIEAYEKDPHVHDRISVHLFLDLLDAGVWALEHVSEFRLPLLLMHGDADRITSAEASREFARAGGSHITLQIWDGFYHEIHNELEQEEVFSVMVIWMDARLVT